jgi:hypothetical protein
MKYLPLLFLLLGLNLNAQTGSLKCNVTFNQHSGCATDNLILTTKKDTIRFLKFQSKDTLSGIPVGTYQALFYDCDSTHTYSQMIEITEDEIRYFNFFNNAGMRQDRYSDLYDEMYYDTNDFVEAWLNHGFEFGRGLDYDNEAVNLTSNYSFQYSVGQDYMLNQSPFALGFDCGLKFSQYNYGKVDLIDTSVVHEDQRYTSLDLTAAVLASIYIKEKKLLDIGIKYNLPLYARGVAKNGNQKLTTKGIHNYKDFSAIARIGYWWGFIYGEYRFNDILSSPYENAPNLTIGIRFNAPIEWW